MMAPELCCNMPRMKTIRLVLCLVAWFYTACLGVSQSIPAKKSAEFDHSTVYVRDLQKSADFYARALGLERIPEPFKDGLHVWFRIGSHLDQMSIKYRKSIRDDSKGTSVRPDGVHQLYFQDPDGYWIEINDDRF